MRTVFWDDGLTNPFFNLYAKFPESITYNLYCYWEKKNFPCHSSVCSRQWHLRAWALIYHSSPHHTLTIMCVCVSCSVISNSLQPHELQPTKLFAPWDYSNKNTGVGSHSLLQGIFLTKGLNPSLLYCRQILYCLSFQGSPAIIRLGKRIILIESFYPHLGFPEAKHKEWVFYNAKCDSINIFKLNGIISITFIIFRVSCSWIYRFNVLVLSF